MKIYQLFRDNNKNTRQYYVSTDIKSFVNSLTQLWLRRDLHQENYTSSCEILPQTIPKQMQFDFTRYWNELWQREPTTNRYTAIELDDSLTHYAVSRGYIEKMLKELRKEKAKIQPKPQLTQVIR